SGPDVVATDGTTVFWTNDGSGTVSDGPLAMASPMAFADTNYAPAGLLVDDKYVYWAVSDGSSATNVVATPKMGGKAMMLASGAQARWLAMNSTALFWAEPARLMKVRKP